MQIWDCSGGIDQQWRTQPDGTLMNLDSDRCVTIPGNATASGVNVTVADCTGGWNQVWTPTGNYGMANTQSRRCADLWADGTANGTHVITWVCNNDANQLWQPQPNNTWKNPVSNRCLDIVGSGTAAGTFVQLWDCTAAANQIWIPQADGTLKNPASNRCLDTGANPAGQQRLRIADCNAASITQRWLAGIPDYDGLTGAVAEARTINGTTEIGTTYREYTVTQTGTRPTADGSGQDLVALMGVQTGTRARTRIDATNGWRWTETRTSYDNYGLPTQVRDLGDTSTAVDDICTSTAYARNTTTYLIDFPSQQTIRAGAGCATGDTRLGEDRIFYDTSTTLGAAPTRGLATRTQSLVDDTPVEQWATTESGFDIHGRTTSGKDARGKTTTTAYTPGGGGPVLQVTVTNPLGHATTLTSDGHRGLPVTIVDPNGKTTTAAYDPLGRLTKVWLPGHPTSGTPTLEHAYTLSNTGANVVTTRKIGPNGNQITSFHLFDGRLRPRQTQGPAPVANGGRIITDTAYDARGLPVKQSRFWNSAAPGAALASFADTAVKTQTRTTHDLLERVTASQVWSQNVMKWQTTTGYDGDRVMVTPPTGGIPTTTISNAHGQPIELRQHTAGTTSGAYQATTYAYDRLHRLTTVTDPAGNQWQNTYDPGGRVTESRDPDKGTTTFTHNAAGDVLTSTDARTTTLSYSYDDLGRKTELWHGPVGSGTRRAAWTYDTLTAGGTVKGQLIRSTRYKTANEPYSIEVSAFDDQYRPLETKVSLPATEDTLAGPWTSSTTYKPDGSVATQTYPAAGSLPAETVTVGYDNNGYPLTRAGLDTYISATAYDNWGTVNTRTLGAGAKRVQLTAAVDEATGRLTENRVSTEHPTTPGSFVPQLIEQYGHDNAGNVTSISEVTPAGATVSNQCFTYDSLRQLTEAWTTTTATCQTTPTQAAVGGPDPYWTSYRYNGIGNRTQEIVHTTGGETTRTYTYPASGAGSVRPHAVQNIAITGPSTGIDTYGYDQAGNTTTRNLAGKPGQTLTWDPEGHLATVTDTGGTTSYLYTADGQRLVAYEPGSVTTLYLGGFELRRTTTGVSCTRYYGVASRSTSGGLTWLAADHHSTRQVAIDPTTLATTRRRTDPFGNPRGALPAWPTTRGFLDGTADATGLTHLGAREYEPNAGRFISVDPIMDLADPTQWNGYAYANNNPTTGSDPTGLITCHGRQEGDLCPGQKIGPWAGTPAGDVARDKHFGGGTKHRNTDNSFTGKSNKQEEPTVLDVLDQIVSRATGGTVPTLQGWLDKTCERVGRAKCKILRDSMDRLIKEAGGKPFDCDAFPNSAQCKENFEKWAEEAYEHLEATVTVCDVVCLSFEFQGGYLQLVVGAGSSGFGGTVVWNTRSYSDQGSVSVAVCGAKIIGACYGFGPTVDSDGEWNGVNHAAGIAFGVGGVRPAVAYVVGSYNVHTGEVVGPQDPLPPVIYHMACKLSWWC